MKRMRTIRRVSQAFFLFLFIYILWSTTYPLSGVFSSSTFFKIDPLIMIFTSVSERLILPGILLSLVMILMTIILGRFFCGWVCPLGAMIDAAGLIGKRRTLENDTLNARVRAPKFLVLGLVGFLSVLGIQAAWVFDPTVIMARFVSLNLIPSFTLIVDRLFVIAIKDLGLHGALYDIYRPLKESLLGVHVYYFAHSGTIAAFFFFVLCLTMFMKRFWCRALCPLGALYAAVARLSLLRRIVQKCRDCKRCKSACRMGAIKDDLDYVKGECVLCMDCLYNCPDHATRFERPRHKRQG